MKSNNFITFQVGGFSIFFGRFIAVSMFCVAALLTSDVLAAPTKQLKPKKHDARYAYFRDKIDTIILAPLIGPKIVGRDDVPSMVENLLVTSLGKIGKQVIPSDTHAKLWSEKIEELGGIYDPISGDKYIERSTQLDDYVRKGVEQAHDFDAILTPTLIVRELTHNGSKVSWDGTRQSIFKPGAKKLFGKSSAPEFAVLRTLTIQLTLKTPDGQEFYVGKLGWELLEKYSKKGKENVLPQDLLNDEQFNQELIDKILKPLLKKHRYLYERGIYKG